LGGEERDELQVSKVKMTDSVSGSKPLMAPYRRHIFVCVGEKCHTDSSGVAVYEHLKQKLKENRTDPDLQLVMRSKSTCLGVCQKGPICVVYPEGVWYCGMTNTKMDRIVNDHLKQGKPVQDWVFYPQP